MSDNFWLYFFGFTTQIGVALIGLVVAWRTKKQTGENTTKIAETAEQVADVRRVAEATQVEATQANTNIGVLHRQNRELRDFVESDVLRADKLESQMHTFQKRATDWQELRESSGEVRR